MLKRIYRKMAIVLVLLFMVQLMSPIGDALAANTMLPPSNITVQLVTPEDAKLTWNSIYGATGYKIYGIIDGQLILLGSTQATNYTFNDLPEGSHRYVVSTLNGTEESGPSAPVTVDITYPDMAAPTTLTKTIQNGNDIVLTWNASQYAQSYKLYEIKPDGQQTLVTSLTGLTYKLVNMAPGTYKYAVSSVNTLYGESPLSTPVEVELIHPTMTSPQTFTYTLTNVNNVTLKWSAVTYATGYKVYQVLDGEKLLRGTVTGTSLTYDNMPAGDYTYEIHSYSDRFGESADSKQVSFTVGTLIMLPPGDFSYKVQNGNDIVFTWGPVSNTTNYRVYQIIDGQKVLKSTLTGTSITYTNMPAGEYIYQVNSYNDRFGESAEGSQVQLTLVPVIMLPPMVLMPSLQNINDLTLNWDAAAYANSYKIYQLVDGQRILKTTTSSLTSTFTNLPGGDYTYEIRSYSTRFGESAEGRQVSLTVPTVTMEPPGNLTSKILNGNDIVLTWEAVQYANSYKIYQVVNGQKILKSTVTGLTVTYPNLPAGDYTFEVYSYSSRFGESPVSSKISLPLVQPIMEAPLNVTPTIRSSTEFSLSWDPAMYATSYKVYQIVNGQKVLKNTVTGTSVTYTNMPSGDYTYKVYTYSTRFGESIEGTQVQLTLNGQTMQEPIAPTYTITNGNDITLKWTGVPFANSYKIYQLVAGQKVLKSTVTGTSVNYTNMPAGDYNYIIHSYSTLFGESPNGAELNISLVFPQMAAPSSLTYKLQNVNDVVLTWTAVQFANSYKVYELVDGHEILKATTTALTTTFTNVPHGNHTYILRSESSRFGLSAEVAQASVFLEQIIMLPPSNQTYSITNGNNITLNWNPSTYATGYKVYQIVNGEKVLKSTLAGTTITYTNMPAGDYRFEVSSYSTRFGESPEISEIAFTLDKVIMLPPVNPTYTVTNGNDLTLKWNGSTYANSYKIYQLVEGQKVLKSTVTGTSVNYTNLPEGDYTYIIHSYSTLFGESPDGAELNISLVFPQMAAPSSLTYRIQNVNDVVLTWTGVQYANSYKVYELVDGQESLKTTTTALTTTFTNVPHGNHTYIVRSESSRFGQSEEGAQASLFLEQIIMLPPTNLTHSVTNGNDIVLKWDTSTYANSYKVYQIINGEKVLKSTVTGTSINYTNMPAGDYHFEVSSYSTRFGESPESTVIAFTLEKTIMLPPVNPTYNVTNGNDLTLKWNASTYANSYKVYQIVNGEKVLKSTLSGTTIAYTNMPAGDYRFEVNSYSTRFGESPESTVIAFTLEKVIMLPPGNPTYTITNGNDITLKWNTSTYANSYKIYELVDGQKILKSTVTGTSVTYTNMPAGEHKFLIHSNSTRFDESPEAGNLDFVLIWPVIQPPVLKGDVFNANNISFSWQPVLWANEYRLYEVKGDSRQLVYKGTALTYKVYNLTEDNHYYEITAYNNRFGESAPSSQLNFNIIYPEMQSPMANLVLLSPTSARIYWDFVVYANGYNIYEIIDGKPVLLVKNLNNLAYTFNDLTYANHEYYVTSYSNSFGESQPSDKVIAKLIVDTEPPVTTADAPRDWTNEAPSTVTLSATDNETGITNTYYSLNDSAFVTGTSVALEREGVNKISFYSVDKVGNTEEAKTIYVKIDKTLPVTTASEVPAWSKEPVNVTLTAKDGLSGIAKTLYAVDGSEYQEGTAFTVVEEGIHKVNFYSVDAAGNIEEPKTIYVKIDKTAPDVIIGLLGEYNLGSKLQVVYSAKDYLSGVAEETMTIFSPNDLKGKVVANGTDFLLDKPGTYNVTLTVTDAAGNSITIQKQFGVIIPANIEVTPKVINGNKGIFTIRVQLPQGYSTDGIDLDTATLNGVKALNSNNGYYKQAKLGQFKFERSDFNWVPSEMIVTFHGYADGNLVTGQTTVTVQK